MTIRDANRNGPAICRAVTSKKSYQIGGQRLLLMAAPTLRNELSEYCVCSVGMLCSRSRIDLIAMILSVCADRAECNGYPGTIGYCCGIVAKLTGVGVDGANILIVGMRAAVPRVGTIRTIGRRVIVATSAAYSS